MLLFEERLLVCSSVCVDKVINVVENDSVRYLCYI